MTFRRYTLASAIVASMAASTVQAVELDTQQISGQLFEQNIAEQAFAVEVLDRSDIELLPVSNIADALEWVSGLDVRQRGSGGTQVDLSIRGAGYEQTLILVDGVRMNDPQTGHHNFDLPLVLEDIERIEVVRGPGAGQYGPNGNAGVINLVTRKQVDGRVAGIKLEAGSKDYDRAMISLGKTEGNWSQFAAFSQQKSDSYIRGADLDYTTQQGNYRLVHQNDSHTTVLGLGYMDKGFGAQGFYAGADKRANENTIQRHVYFTHDQRFDNDLRADIAINWRQHDDEFFYLNYAPSEHQTNAWQTRLRLRLANDFALGYEHNQEDIDSTSVTDNRHKRDYSSVFAYGQHDLGVLQLAGSLSYLNYDDGDSYTLPVLGMTIPFAGQQLYLNAGQSARVPTMNDLYLNQTANKGNPDVQAEETTSYELGLRFNLAGALGRLAIFNRETTDAIDYTRTDAEVAAGSAYIARNIESIKTKGLDAEVDISGLLAETGFLKASLSYTRLIQDFTNQYAEARYSQSQFEHQAILSLAYEIIPGLSATSQYKFESRYNQDGYRLWDLGVKQTFDQWHWALAATNVLGTEYIDSGYIEAPLNAYRLEIGAGF
ncbi:TonB-dependent receptor plug domain-containing protein [Thalassolituus marinus]|uniref:TonB-dependent receptor n=1 Tax=Thalassolituus marinus TaxID=671053 RepID=A0ABS7ZKU7_9GAMM|nr:TonB-dependent receptor [Thalassolituus marinus]MCA6062317.1 TonB-dependent receptor [Thalassolituus marinus]